MIVLNDWLHSLSLQQQSVCLLACRGPDGVAKFHPCKEVIRAYRATVLRAAYYGREMRFSDPGDTFMSFKTFKDSQTWDEVSSEFFKSVDDIPHHYYLHLLHGAAIIGYHHPEMIFKLRWHLFYIRACKDMHVNPETQAEMDERLNDWNRVGWA